MPLGVFTGLTASITDAETVMTSTAARCEGDDAANARSGRSLDAGVTAAS